MNELQKAREEAKVRIEEYFSDGDFGVAHQVISYDYGVQSERTLTDCIATFLSGRRITISDGINQKRLDELVDRADFDVVSVIGETVHFVRKLALKNYEFRNPIPLVESTFRAIEPSTNEYAAKFLRIFCDLMRDDTKPQLNVSFVLGKILPQLIDEYQSVIGSTRVPQSDGYRYQKVREIATQQYTEVLDAMIDYAKGLIRNHLIASGEDFQQFRKSRKLPTTLVPNYIK